jgi:phosphoribosylanthranilate isomerase
MAVDAGASAVGLVSAMPSGPGPIPEGRIAEIAAWVPPGVATFLLTSLTKAEEIAEQHARCPTNVMQLVDAVPRHELVRLRELLPDIKLVQVIHVRDERAITEARGVVEFVDGLLLDSGNPQAEVKILGGTGNVHNWEFSAEIVRQSRLPVYLAGGLNPENVGEAIRTVRPFGVDVCSGLRYGELLSEEKLTGFMKAVAKIDRDAC